MITFIKPANLNGAELRQELRSAGVEISDDFFAVSLTDNVLSLDINPSDESAAAAVVAAHNGTTIAPKPTVAEKLASVGLNIDDLKTALGL